MIVAGTAAVVLTAAAVLELRRGSRHQARLLASLALACLLTGLATLAEIRSTDSASPSSPARGANQTAPRTSP